MTFDQAAAFAILGGAIILFIWDRLRYDLVAMLALLAAIAVGIVPVDKAFSGFSDQIVIVVGSALVVSAAIARSGIAESLIAPLAPYMRRAESQIAVLGALVALLSAFMKNIGALAIFIPIAIQMARKNDRSPGAVLMPLSFASLLGGLMTLIGTSPNIIVARVRAEITGEPFGMFDYLPVGAVLTAAGIIFLIVGYRLLPQGRQGKPPPEELFEVEDYFSEARIPAGASVIGKTVGDVEAMSDGDVMIAAIIREKNRRYTPAADWTLYEDDILVLEGDPHTLQRVVSRAGLELLGTDQIGEHPARAEDVVTIEAVVTAQSAMAGHTLAELRLRDQHQVNLLAVSRRTGRVTARLPRVRFRSGDVVVLQGTEDAMTQAMTDLKILPLAQRNVQLGVKRRALIPVLVLAAAMTLIALDVVPVTVGFFGAAVLLIAFGSLTLREAYEAVEWPILILLASLIPVSDALQATGATDLIARWLSELGPMLPPFGMLAMVMIAAMLVTPFLNNAATVLVMGPVAASFAQRLGLNVDPFLMAVAVGAACDFLTPIGHQCNTLVMGPGGYKFSDYWRLGLPLSIIVVALGVPMIMLVWPL